MTPEDYARLYEGRVASFKVGGLKLVPAEPPPPFRMNRKQRRTWLAQQRRQKGRLT